MWDFFAKKVCKDERWNTWADNWLNGTDRSKESAYIAYDYAAYSYATSARAAYAAYFYATYARAAYAADAAHAADAILYAFEDTDTLDEIITIIDKAMEY